MNFGTKHIDYYSDYDQSSFFTIVDLQKRIPKLFSDTVLLNAAVFWQTNVERIKHGLQPFHIHEKLIQTATLHSQQMRLHCFFDHENHYETKYKTLTNRMDLVKGKDFAGFMSYAENIADCSVIKANESFTYSNTNGSVHLYSMDGKEILPFTYAEMAKSVVDAWMNSPGHRKNILNQNYKYLGCGCAPYEMKCEGYSITYFKLTQNFGGILVPLPLLESVKQNIRTVFNPHGTENTNKSKLKRLVWGLEAKKGNNTMVKNQGLSYNVDLVFCIDVTGSMRPVMNVVKENALKLYPDLMRKMDEKGKNVDTVRIKVIAFRDFEVDRENALQVLDFVDLKNNQDDYTSFIKALEPEGGGPIPENGLEALAMAMDSDWNKGGDKRRHIIVVYTDATTHPLEKESKYKPAGMPANFNELTDWWDGQGGKMETDAKRLILFAPDAEPWTDIANFWTQVIHYPSRAAKGLSEVDYEQILKIIANSI